MILAIDAGNSRVKWGWLDVASREQPEVLRLQHDRHAGPEVKRIEPASGELDLDR